ncbi:ABC transporter permease [Halocynthiibacter namhaensis]|uniref:ABC transporter permease n=1 Tax=Halocynthiibacter namhaensis TaxID=1290553 RepID=UPI000689BF10
MGNSKTVSTAVRGKIPFKGGFSIWSLGAFCIATFVILPVLAVVYLAFFPTENIWPHLLSTTLPRYFTNTLVLMLSVGILAGATGIGAAWLIVMYKFPGARMLEWLLLLPLAIPAYVGAYALVDFLEYSGPVQTLLRDIFGWATSRDYWFPDIRSRGAAIIVLAGALYPYVYLLTRSAFREQSAAGYDVARALGVGPFARFFRVGLPLARPALAASCAVVMMETVADFGTVEFFAVQTLTTGIFTTWLESNNAGGAAQIAVVVLMLVLLLSGSERISRRKHRYHNSARNSRPVIQTQLSGTHAALALAFCLVPFCVGFLLPVGVISWHSAKNYAFWLDRSLIEALWNTVFTGMSAGLITVTAALFMVYGVRLSGKRLPRLLLPLTTVGYAAPGAVLAVGILIPLAAFDHILADTIVAITGYEPGLLLTGTAVALIFAYSVRFFAIAQGAADSALGRVSPSFPMAARSLGRSDVGVLRDVHAPLIRGSVTTAILLVFVDCAKELPATLLLRPFNFNTLATRVYEQASLENLEQAAPAAMLVILTGLCAVMILARASR